MDKIKLTIAGHGEFEIDYGKKLLLALKDDVGVNQLHACGGKAKCTTCKVKFISAEPDQTTQAEQNILTERGIQGLRLSCQILCKENLTIELVSLLEGSGRSDCGSEVPKEIIPDPVWEAVKK